MNNNFPVSTATWVVSLALFLLSIFAISMHFSGLIEFRLGVNGLDFVFRGSQTIAAVLMAL